MKTLSRPISNHIPHVIKLDSHILKASIFSLKTIGQTFRVSWTVKLHWHSNPFYANMDKTVSGKFK